MPAFEHQCLDAWALGLGWASLSDHALLCVGFHGPPGGQCCGRAPSLSPARFTSLGLLETPQVGYLIIIPIFQHIQVE